MASAGNVMLRGRYTDLFASRLAYIDEILYDVFDAPTLTYPSAFNVRSSSRAYEETSGITGFGQFSQKSEGSKVDYDTLLQAYDKRYTHLTYAKGYQISTEAMTMTSMVLSPMPLPRSRVRLACPSRPTSGACTTWASPARPRRTGCTCSAPAIPSWAAALPVTSLPVT